MRLVRLTAMPPNDFSPCTHARKRLQKYKEILDLQKKRLSFPFPTPALHQPYYSPTQTEDDKCIPDFSQKFGSTVTNIVFLLLCRVGV